MSRKPAEDRKAEIVAAMLSLADRIGPDRLTTNDVAREVGVTQAAIFRHFPTKADLWAATGEAVAERLSGAWTAAMGDGSTPRERLRALVATQLRQIVACPALPSILHSRELAADNVVLRQTCQRLILRFEEHLAADLQRLTEAGELDPALPPRDAAILLITLVQGLAIRWTLGARNFALEDEGLRLLDLQLSLFSRGRDRT